MIIHSLFDRIFPHWSTHFIRGMSECESVLDLGCGYNSPLQLCDVPYSVGVDIFQPELARAKELKIHSEYVLDDIRHLDYPASSFDGVIAISVVEHFTKDEGYELISNMTKWARKKVILSLPNGHWPQGEVEGNPYQEHQAEWTTSDLELLGFNIFGQNGLKPLRGYRGVVKYKPARLWERISDITQVVTFHWPDIAAQLYCVLTKPLKL